MYTLEIKTTIKSNIKYEINLHKKYTILMSIMKRCQEQYHYLNSNLKCINQIVFTACFFKLLP